MGKRACNNGPAPPLDKKALVTAFHKYIDDTYEDENIYIRVVELHRRNANFAGESPGIGFDIKVCDSLAQRSSLGSDEQAGCERVLARSNRWAAS